MPDLCSPSNMARWFVNRVDREAGESITHLKLQKLLYFAQAYHLANFNRQIFEEDMQAWTHGPVVPSVWQEFKDYGWDAIPAGEAATELPAGFEKYLNAVYEKFSPLGAKALERLTHEHDPWKTARGDIPPEARCTAAIDKLHMREFYGKRIKKSWGRKAEIRS